jgi:hypothetical protein
VTWARAPACVGQRSYPAWFSPSARRIIEVLASVPDVQADDALSLAAPVRHRLLLRTVLVLPSRSDAKVASTRAGAARGVGRRAARSGGIPGLRATAGAGGAAPLLPRAKSAPTESGSRDEHTAPRHRSGRRPTDPSPGREGDRGLVGCIDSHGVVHSISGTAVHRRDGAGIRVVTISLRGRREDGTEPCGLPRTETGSPTSARSNAAGLRG